MQTHHMQLHGGLRGRVLLIRGLSFRRAFTFHEPMASAPAHTLELEIVLGPCDVQQASATFAANYQAPPTVSYVRKTVSLPDWVAPVPSPAPWNVVLPADAPYVHDGTADLAWEALVFRASALVSYFADTWGDNLHYAVRRYLPGCVTSGLNRYAYLASVTTFDSQREAWSLSWNCGNFYANLPVAILVGVANPELAIPGFCAKLYVTPLVVLAGVTTASGTWDTGPIGITWNPAIVGASLFAQAIGPDAGAPGLPVTASWGLETTAPTIRSWCAGSTRPAWWP
jgi:hypothetical protein